MCYFQFETMDFKIFQTLLVCLAAVHVQRSIATESKPQVATNDGDLFPLSIIHINDFHAR